MRFSFVAATLALASSALAGPLAARDNSWGNWGNGNCASNCLSQATAESIVNQYISILAHTDATAANATAQALLADDYQEISDSILSLEGQPVS